MMRISLHSLPPRAALLASAAIAAGLLAGCGLTNPDSASTSAAASTTTQTNPEPTHERSGTIPSSATAANNTLSAGAGGSTQAAAISQYADLWCNWTSSNLIQHERELEALSLGGARAQEADAIAAPRERGTHIANTCKTVSIALAAANGPAAGQWVLVTSSNTSTNTTSGLSAQLHVTYVNLIRHASRWVINQWSPQI